MSEAAVLEEIAADPTATPGKKKAARRFALKDRESQVVGRIPARFLEWSDRDPPPRDHPDSDSDEETTDGED